MSVFHKVADGTEGGTNLTITVSGTNKALTARIYQFSKGAGSWSVACGIGSKDSGGSTAYSITTASDPGIAAGDIVQACTAINSDAYLYSAASFTTSGVTYGANTELDDVSNPNSANLRYLVNQSPVSSGASSGNTTFAATATGSATNAPAGPTVVVRIREEAGGLSITSVDTDNAVLASQSQATFAGTGLASTAKFAVKRGSAIAYATDISLSGSTGGSFTAPTMAAMFSAGVRFGDVAFYAAETSGTAIASISGSITTATNWKYVNVTDLSATASMGSLFYNNAVSLSDQVAYSSVTTRFRWPVTVSGDGYFTVNSSGSQAGDEFAYRIWDETDSTWGTEGTIEINGGISSAEQVYAAGSLVQVSLESSTLEGATLQ